MKRSTQPLARLVISTLMSVLLIPAVLAVVVGLVVSVTGELTSIHVNQRHRVEMAARFVDSYLQNVDHLLSLMAVDAADGDFSVGAALLATTEHPNGRSVPDHLFHRVSLVDNRLQTVSAIPPDDVGIDLSGTLATIEPSERTAYTAPSFSPFSDSVSVLAIRRVNERRTIVAELCLNALQDYVGSAMAHEDEEAAILTDTYGNVIAHPDMQLVAEQANIGPEIPHPNLNDSGTWSGYQRLDGELLLTSITTEPSSGWIVILRRNAYQSIAPSLWLATFATVVLLVLIWIIIAVLRTRLRRMVVEPLATFTSHVDGLVHGSYADSPLTALGPPTFTELERLDADFRQLGGVIRTREEQLRRSEQRWHFALESAGDGVWDWDVSSDSLFFSAQMHRMLGYTSGELPSSTSQLQEVIHPADLEIAVRAYRGIINRSTDRLNLEYRLRCKDGTYRWILARGAVIEQGTDDEPMRVIGTHSDIAERKEYEREITQAAREKETLLKEIHHRVKNNLNVVASLLSLQSDGISDVAAARTALATSRDRILSIARVHESLYGSQDLSSIEMGAYIRGMVRELAGSFDPGGSIQFEIDAQDARVDIEYAVPCGIILNELITNALIHAFPDERTGTVAVRFSVSPDRHRISVRDNGIGLQPAATGQARETLGLKLVELLADQINGTLTTETSGGTEVSISWRAR